MKASFWSRLAAYVIDFIIISILASVICSTLPTKENTLEENMSTLAMELVEGKITAAEYIEEYKDLLYAESELNVIETTVSLLLTIGYFVVFQYMNKGQTAGKKLLNIRVVDNDTEKPASIYKGLLRTIIIFNIISGLMGSLFISILNKSTYITIYMIVVEMEGLLALLCALFVALRKDDRGLHDLIANTKVIKEER